ncbi:hypothetical protein [Arenibaculum pallidiluteum]|uniref:hypothetical protein n=1 Tax=Arenibaculum pallidiluteum TaxID=2812559 RepID=UPI001A972714|nr:hypothetical protein [Arenibaculum pallidiluteum]
MRTCRPASALIAAALLAAPLLVPMPIPLGSAPARAQESPQHHHGPAGRPDDTVVLEISAEEWVQTGTAEVAVTAEAAAGAADTGRARAELLAAVRALAPDAEWRLVRFTPSTDSAGLERWYAEAQARLAETQLGGLGERARQASRPGLQLRVDRIDFTPTLAEVEAVKTRLRAEIYRRVGEEIAAVNAAYSDRAFRLGTVRFQEPGMPGMPHPARMKTMEAAPAEMAAPVQVGDRLRLTAQVVLKSVPPPR